MHPLRLLEHDGRFSLLLDCGDNAIDDAIRDAGHEPNGYFWEGIAQLIIAMDAPDLEGAIELDPEAGMFCAYSEDREALEVLGAAMAAVANDEERLQTILAAADERGFTFDD